MEALLEAPKFCKNCKHLLGKRTNTETAAWRCYHPENILSITPDLVTGEAVIAYKLTNIYSQRSSDPLMEATCGVEGKLFQLYIQPEYASYNEPEAATSPRLRTAKPKLEDLI